MRSCAPDVIRCAVDVPMRVPVSRDSLSGIKTHLLEEVVETEEVLMMLMTLGVPAVIVPLVGVKLFTGKLLAEEIAKNVISGVEVESEATWASTVVTAVTGVVYMSKHVVLAPLVRISQHLMSWQTPNRTIKFLLF